MTTTPKPNPLSIGDVIVTEESVCELHKQLVAFRKTIPPNHHMGELYNYMGTLKVNLLSLQREVQRTIDAISIQC